MSKFNEGDEVLIISSGMSGRRCVKSTVERVYKNGNFRIAGDGRQWRQGGSHTSTSWMDTSRATPFDAAIYAEIRAEMELAGKRLRLTMLADAFNEMEPTQAAEIWDALPDSIKALAK